MHDPREDSVRQLRNFEPVSYTARKILQKRALHTDIPLAKEIADAAGVAWRVSKLRALMRRMVWGEIRSGRYLQFRHDAISDALARFPQHPVLEVGAGFGTRGLIESGRREAYVEADLPDVIERKRALVEELGGAPNHHFLSLNVCDRADGERTRAFLQELRLDRPILVVHEGLMMYFDAADKRTFLELVTQLIAPRGGAWITPDFSERDVPGNAVQNLLNLRLTRQVGRQLNRFRSDDEVSAFLSSAGLEGTKLPHPIQHAPTREVSEAVELSRAWIVQSTFPRAEA
jgi:O-methyltransferase involved in polyketide biosynthesis